MKSEIRNNIEIILVTPEEPGNVGATARAMKNMGFSRLGLVRPCDYKDPFAYKMAWNSHEILNAAKVYPDLPSALSQKGFVVAMTTRKGKDRGPFEPLHEFRTEIYRMAMSTQVAILFGPESHGLLNEDLLYANRCVEIHTAGEYRSLNLAQAVLLTCYELLCCEEVPATIHASPAKQEDLEACYVHVEKILHDLGYGIRGQKLLPGNILGVMRKMAGRAVLTKREVRMVRGLCSQVEKFVAGKTPDYSKRKNSKDPATSENKG
jgi:TrmH family RNA methyltransferase